MKNYFICIVCILLFMPIFGCGQNKLERDAEYYHKYGMNYDQYQNFQKAEKNHWMKDYLQSPVYFPREKNRKK